MARLVLGTAQLGMKYGVGNVTGQPAPETAVELLRQAQAAGIAAVDTAPGYGDAEELIGRAGIGLEVFTKLDPGVPPGESIERSLRRLQRSSVGVVFLHQPELVEADPTGVIARAIGHLGEHFESLGASVYTSAQFRAALDDPRITTIQAPVSVVDQRLAQTGLLADAGAAGTRVVARSVYLQGSLILAPDALPPHLAVLAGMHRELADLARKAGLGVAELLLRFVRDLPGVSDVLVGCETPEQLAETGRAFAGPALDKDMRVALELLAVDDEGVLDPRLWPPA